MTRDQRNIGFSRFHEILNDRLKKEDDSCDQEILIVVRVILFLFGRILFVCSCDLVAIRCRRRIRKISSEAYRLEFSCSVMYVFYISIFHFCF